MDFLDLETQADYPYSGWLIIPRIRACAWGTLLRAPR